MERDAVRRAFEPVDFFEIANLDHPREPIARGCHCLLYGPAGSGKTTLLFHHALIAAKRDPDARVLFVCRREAIEAAYTRLAAAAPSKRHSRCQQRMLLDGGG